MRKKEIVIGGVAVGCGLLALVLMNGGETPTVLVPQPVVQAPETVDVLVAAEEIGVGQGLTEGHLRWQAWPVSAMTELYISRNATPNAIDEWKGAVARAPFAAGEPLRAQKLIKTSNPGFVSAILPSGSRAISVEISPETGAGGFILPNDRVDIILTRRDHEATKATGIDTFRTETILRNVRVLGIDQTVEEKNGEKAVVGRTATLELAPQHTEVLALSRQLGTLSLALRSLVDSNPNSEAETGSDLFDDKKKGLTVIRYGISTQTGK